MVFSRSFDWFLTVFDVLLQVLAVHEASMITHVIIIIKTCEEMVATLFCNIAFLILLRVVGRSRGLPDAFWTDLQRIGTYWNISVNIGKLGIVTYVYILRIYIYNRYNVRIVCIQ